MWDLKACRGCLASKGKLERITEVSKRLYTSITGIEIKDNDGYPTYFCMECHMFIRKAFAFRRKCRRAHFVLKEIVIVRKQATLNDIFTVNRKTTNLESSLGKWKLHNNAFYNIHKTECDTDTKDNEIPMVRYKPIVNNFSIYHIIDIESTVLPDTVKNECEERIAGEADAVKFENGDGIELDTQENIETSMDIDLEDVFKDLKDDHNLESDFEFLENSEQFPQPVKLREKKESKAIVIDEKIEMRKTAIALCNVHIKKISIDEQREVLEKRMKSAVFKSAAYKCSICMCVLDNIYILMEHVHAHNSSINKHLCAVCKNSFVSNSKLEEHIAKNHLYIYQCKTCDEELYTLDQVVDHYFVNHKHVRIYRKPRNELTDLFDIISLPQEEMCVKDSGCVTDFKCFHCGTCFNKRKEYDLHMKTHEEPAPNVCIYQCEICKTWHKTRTMMEKHMADWHIYKYQCKLCNGVFYNLEDAKKHKWEEGKQCQYCKKRFRSYPTYYGHWYDCQYRSQHLYHCTICGYSISSEYNLYMHQLSEHQYFSIKEPAILGSEFACTGCNVQFLSKRAYQIHVLRHNHPEARNIRNSCYLCRKLFDTDEEYQCHQIVCKNNKKFPRKCQYCEDVLTSRLEYNQHLITFHPSMEDTSLPKLHLCHLCGKMVRGKYSVHMRAHQTRQWFKCELCTPAVRFPNANSCAAHVISAHTHRPYSCALCDLTFKVRNDCRDHILKIHSPVFPYKCIICEQMFSHSSFLISHLKKAHRVITDKNPNLKLVPIRSKVITYPHMRINLSMLDKNLLDIINVELTDYLHEKTQILEDYSDYVILEPSYQKDDVTEPLDNPLKRVKSPNKGCIPKKKRRKDDSLSVAIDPITEEVAEEMVEIPQRELIIDENIDNASLPVIEHNGDRFVVINGVIYKIEND